MWVFPNYTSEGGVNWQAMLAQFSWLRDMQKVPQDPIWHAEGDVLTHTKMVVEALIKLPEFARLSEQNKHILVAAALLHDVEKRSTTTTEIIDGMPRIVSPRHAKRGEYTARCILYKNIPTPFFIREAIVKLVRYHGLPLWAIEKPDPQKAVINASLVLNTQHLSLLAKADVLGRICADKEELLFKIALFEELCKENACFGNARHFKSGYARFLYCNKSRSSPNYVPYDNLIFTVYMLSGLPGTGKDTYINSHLDKSLPILSLDAIRRKAGIAPTHKKKNGVVIQQAKEEAKIFMRAKQSFVFNATNITTDMRRKWIGLFTSYGAKVQLLYIEVPYIQLLAQNRNRTYVVPQKVIERLLTKLEIPSCVEAHDLVYVIGNEC